MNKIIVGGKPMNKLKQRKKISWDERGALEGLPLYLIILVVITAIAIVIMITWLSTMQEPDLDTIEIEITGSTAPAGTLYADEQVDITITAKGTNGKSLEGVSVELNGEGIVQTLKTQSGGTVTFQDVTPTLGNNVYTGSITVTATYSGNVPITKTDSIPVNTP